MPISDIFWDFGEINIHVLLTFVSKVSERWTFIAQFVSFSWKRTEIKTRINGINRSCKSLRLKSDHNLPHFLNKQGNCKNSNMNWFFFFCHFEQTCWPQKWVPFKTHWRSLSVTLQSESYCIYFLIPFKYKWSHDDPQSRGNTKLNANSQISLLSDNEIKCVRYVSQ